MTAEQCEFCFMDYCDLPDEVVKAGFVCSFAIPAGPGDIKDKCGASDEDLINFWSDEEYLNWLETNHL